MSTQDYICSSVRLTAYYIYRDDLPETNDQTVAEIKALLDSVFVSVDDIVEDTEPSSDNAAVPPTPSHSQPHADPTDPVSFVLNGRLNWAVIVSERERHVSSFVRDSVRKNASYIADAPKTDTKPSEKPRDTFGNDLARTLRQANGTATYSSSGGYRQMRYTGTPAAARVGKRGEGRVLVANKAASVSSNRRSVFTWRQRTHSMLRTIPPFDGNTSYH